jgi:uncharacterized protein
MRIAIISDIHDNIPNLEKFLIWCEDNAIESIICCGDVTTEDTLEYLYKNFKGMIHLVEGNMEIYERKDLKALKGDNFHFYGRVGRFESDGRAIGICHEPYFFDKVLELGKCDIIFYGHTHKPWIEEKNGVKFVNPGTLGGVFQKATFAVWNSTKKELQLKLLEKLI